MRGLKRSVFILATLLGVFLFHGSASAVSPGDFGLTEGDVIRASGTNDVFIINEHGYKRLFTNPEIFNVYGHLGFEKVNVISAEIVNSFITSGFFRNCESGDERVFGLELVTLDDAVLRWLNIPGDRVVQEDPDIFLKVFCINNAEEVLYGIGTDLTSVHDIDIYGRLNDPNGTATHSPVFTPTPDETTVSVARVFDTWAPSVARVLCDEFSGSGTLLQLADSTYVILTNSHVVGSSAFCSVSFLINPSSKDVSDENQVFYMGEFGGYLSNDITDDEVLLTLKPFPSAVLASLEADGTTITAQSRSTDFLKGVARSELCRSFVPQIGDDISVIGYPGIGSFSTPTITRGIISGREGNYYLTDAKIDSGNSGGAALLTRANCYLGIPTKVRTGDFESIGRILDMTRFGVKETSSIPRDIIPAGILSILKLLWGR